MWKFLPILAFAAFPLSAQQMVTSAPGGLLRALDKISGQSTDIEIWSGDTATYGSLRITLNECRYPAGNPSGNAYAEIDISESARDGLIFSGWMIASAPALSALEHPRYDVWVIRCITS